MMVVQGLDARGLGTIQPIYSEPSTEEELPMLRLRLASLALASGLLFTLSGCFSTCEDGRLFPRLFRSNSAPVYGASGECDCHSSRMPPITDTGAFPGQAFTMPAGSNPTMPIPITNFPSNQPPQILKVPQAQPTPFVPLPAN
jgi:hypothetical protein